MNKHLPFVKPENLSGWLIDQKYEPLSLNKNRYYIIDKPISGDAPKNFIILDESDTEIKSEPKSWTQYIAKTGNKWYPVESITEHLLNRLGQCLGISMAESMLRTADGQIRFLSKYFLSNDQQLVHGAEIYSGYFENDIEFVNEIERKNEDRNLLTLQLTKKAIHSIFPKQCETILHELVKMILFDAWIGNNDRHFFNWGVVEHPDYKHEPYFSPVYDTARGLFWNYSENKILSLLDDLQRLSQKIEKYSSGSRPKIGWEGEKELNHFSVGS